MIKNIIITVETICIVVLAVVTVNFYNRLPGKTVETNQEADANLQENQEVKNTTEIENFLKQADMGFENNAENSNVAFKEGTYINTDDPEAHYLILEDGKATAGTYETCVGTYRIENNKIYVTYTEEYDPEGNPCELEITQEIFRIEGDTLVEEEPYQMVYKLQ